MGGVLKRSGPGEPLEALNGAWAGADRPVSMLMAGRVGDVLGIPDVDRS